MALNVVYNVAICEDEEIFAEENAKICRNILEKLNITYNIEVFVNGENFLNRFLVGNIKYDIILFDILMDETNGIELAKKVRETDGETSIIFITSSPDYALHGYDVKALHYLMKPVSISTLENLIVADYNNRIKNNYFIFESGAGDYCAFINDIVCLETVGRKVSVMLKNGEFCYAGKLTELLHLMPKDRIIRCHQSFAVNISNIRELNRYSAVAINGYEIPVSRAFSKEVRKAFMKQLWEK